MNKISCDVIRDLLPLYDDGICSEQSSKLVEEHLETCEACEHVYKMMKKKLPKIEENQAKPNDVMAADLMKFLRKKSGIRDLIISLIIIVIGTAVLGTVMYSMRRLHFVPAEAVQDAKVYAAGEDKILWVPDRDGGWFMHQNIELKNGELVMEMGYSYTLYSQVTNQQKEKLSDPCLIYTTQVNDILGEIELDRIVYKDSDNNKDWVIWEKGDTLPDPPEELKDYSEEAGGVGFIDLVETALESDDIAGKAFVEKHSRQ